MPTPNHDDGDNADGNNEENEDNNNHKNNYIYYITVICQQPKLVRWLASAGTMRRSVRYFIWIHLNLNLKLEHL